MRPFSAVDVISGQSQDRRFVDEPGTNICDRNWIMTQMGFLVEVRDKSAVSVGHYYYAQPAAAQPFCRQPASLAPPNGADGGGCGGHNPYLIQILRR